MYSYCIILNIIIESTSNSIHVTLDRVLPAGSNSNIPGSRRWAFVLSRFRVVRTSTV
jgi:hypothetical protein